MDKKLPKITQDLPFGQWSSMGTYIPMSFPASLSSDFIIFHHFYFLNRKISQVFISGSSGQLLLSWYAAVAKHPVSCFSLQNVKALLLSKCDSELDGDRTHTHRCDVLFSALFNAAHAIVISLLSRIYNEAEHTLDMKGN